MTKDTDKGKTIEIISDGDEGDLDLSRSGKEIRNKVSEPEVEALYKKFKKNTLNIQPDFQRLHVWDVKKSSSLIESALLNLPLPVFYFAREQDETESVIDGQQRLTAFFSFIDGKFPDDKPFRLTGLKSSFRELNGKLFGEIGDKYQNRITDFTLRTVSFSKDMDANLRFQMFERLNSGSTLLNAQELRNCVSRGPYNDLLRKLSRIKEYSKLTGFDTPHKRMGDVELVLRFAAFHFQHPSNYASPMKKFLNKEMEERQNISGKDAESLEKVFRKAVALSASVLGKNAFFRFVPGNSENSDGSWDSKKINASLHDILMWTLSRADKNLVMRNLDAIREAYIHLMVNDSEFSESIQLGTSEARKVKLRFDRWETALDKILQGQKKGPRLFSHKIKKNLFDRDSTCELCSNKIANIDDAAVDHIEQYWLGGQTIPENARLTHRYCNAARKRKG